ncbi:DUF2182 domain-containing protein [Thetidibacter halocola]|uniref:DUF2182 domain-containing protein n=1 Tax=Thetidibacter halocola TaxID=2827239 RepID=A0A8J7WCB0_9RHOB|nr:DUF2182 domain-containing protein [Thetidibacter halocola]MBS0123066.1 DUF2182 domain-containing protein [Thetidibacter halocola]
MIRARDALWLGFFAAILAAWGWLYLMARAADVDWLGRPGLWAETLAALCTGPGASVAGFAAVWAMWAAMGAAMMLPTMLPVLRTYQRLPVADTHGMAGLIGGYLAIWGGFAVLAAGAQVGLSALGWLDASGAVTLAAVQGGLLVIAGLYQFSQYKDSCQSACLSPMSFFIGRYRPGTRGAVRMGLELGALCVGCCWAIMALGFVGGVMNLAWMGLATLFMVLEKLPQVGRVLTRPAGGVLVASGAWVALQGFTGG